MMKVFLYKEFNDDNCYGDELTAVYESREDALAHLAERFKTCTDMSMQEYNAEHPKDDPNTVDPDYVCYDTGDGYLFLVVEEKVVIPAKEAAPFTSDDEAEANASDTDTDAEKRNLEAALDSLSYEVATAYVADRYNKFGQGFVGLVQDVIKDYIRENGSDIESFFDIDEYQEVVEDKVDHILDDITETELNNVSDGLPIPDESFRNALRKRIEDILIETGSCESTERYDLAAEDLMMQWKSPYFRLSQMLDEYSRLTGDRFGYVVIGGDEVEIRVNGRTLTIIAVYDGAVVGMDDARKVINAYVFGKIGDKEDV